MPPAVPQADDSLERLRSVKHIVVLMMENRSFDQMLGFLEGEGLDVDGLGSAKPNFDAAGNGGRTVGAFLRHARHPTSQRCHCPKTHERQAGPRHQ